MSRSGRYVAIRAPGGPRWFSWIELSVRDKASNAVSHRAIAREIGRTGEKDIKSARRGTRLCPARSRDKPVGRSAHPFSSLVARASG